MRLTLRTLLAYMDDILEPDDHEDLGKKIEASDFATELIHRSRDTVRRLRLGAPAVISSGSDDVLDSLDLGDANSVAEYLDNTLPPEQVAGFERMCLEQGTTPDMHLAEVASCHHVLTMVLGEPAEIDADLKARMYQLPEKLANGQRLRIEPSHAEPVEAPPQQTAAQAAPPVAAPTSPPMPAVSPVEQEVPDYLREAAASKRRSRHMAIAACLMVAAGAVWFWIANTPPADVPAEVAMSGAESFDDGEIDIQGLDEIGGPPEESYTGDTAEAPPFAPENPASSEAPAFDPNANTGSSTAPPFVPSTPAEQPEEEAPEQPETGEAPMLETPDGPELTTDGPSLDFPETEIPDSTPAGDATATAPSVDPLPDLPLTDADVPASDDPSTDTGEAGPVMIASAPDTPAIDVEPIETDTPEATDTSEQLPPEPTGPQRMGSYMGNNDVLLIHDATRNKWVRMPPRSPISTGDVLLTLPKFLTHVVLADVNTYLSGGTRIHVPMEPLADATGTADLSLEVVHGRLLFNAGLQGTSVAIQIDDQLREFQLAGSSSLAVEVERVFVPGSDYENEAAPIKATWYLTSGSVEWPTATGGTQTIKDQAVWRTVDGIDEIPEQIDELPEWIVREPVTDVERIARGDIVKELVPGQPVGIRLLELTDGKGVGRKKEVRILAAASSVFVGEFEPLIKALNDSDQKRAWEDHIEDLRQSMALSPDSASQIRQTFISLRGEEAAQDLMDMVVGYNRLQIGETRDEVQNGALSTLIKWLDHDSLDYRVLAIQNIKEITGGSMGFLPNGTSRQRTIALRKIWDRFEANELVPVQ